MSSKIEVQRICQHCGCEFMARTTITKYCSHRCNRVAYKANINNGKVETSDRATHLIKNRPIEDLKAKEFLKVSKVAKLSNCSVRSAYYCITNGSLNATNLGQKITRVKRSEIDKLFEQL